MANPFGPSPGVLNQIEDGEFPIAAIAEDIARRNPVAMMAKGVANQPFLRSFAKSASAGLSEPVAAGLTTLALKAGGADESMGDLYKRTRGRQEADLKRMKAENGGQTFAGDLLGVVAPGGAFSRGFAVSNKLTSPLAKGAEKLIENGGVQKALGGALKYAVRPFIRGAVAQVGTEGVNPESRVWRDPEYARNAALLGGISDAGGEIGMKTIKSGLGLAKEYLPVVARMIPGMDTALEYAKKRGAEKASKAFEEGGEKIAAKVGADDVRTAAEGFQEGINKADDVVFDEYKKIVDPVMDRFADAPASAKNLRERIMAELRSAGAVDAKGNIDFESLPFAGPDSSGYKALAKYSQSLQQNPSLAELNRIVRSFGKAANFKGGQGRSEIQRAYGDLFGGGRDDILDAVETLVRDAEMGTKGVRQTQKAFGKAAEMNQAAGQEVGRLEDIVEAQAQHNLPSGITGPTQAELAAAKNAKGQAAEMLSDTQQAMQGMSDAAQAKGAMTADQIKDARSTFARRQQVMERLRKIAGQPDAESVLSTARTRNKSGLQPSYIEDAIAEMPQLREPMGRAVMRNIVSTAKGDPKAMKKLVEETYGRKTLETLFGPEVMGSIDALIAGPQTLSKRAQGMYQKAHQWAVRNPQIARPTLWGPRAVLNQIEEPTEEEQR